MLRAERPRPLQLTPPAPRRPAGPPQSSSRHTDPGVPTPHQTSQPARRVAHVGVGAGLLPVAAVPSRRRPDRPPSRPIPAQPAHPAEPAHPRSAGPTAAQLATRPAGPPQPAGPSRSAGPPQPGGPSRSAGPSSSAAYRAQLAHPAQPPSQPIAPPSPTDPLRSSGHPARRAQRNRTVEQAEAGSSPGWLVRPTTARRTTPTPNRPAEPPPTPPSALCSVRGGACRPAHGHVGDRAARAGQDPSSCATTRARVCPHPGGCRGKGTGVGWRALRANGRRESQADQGTPARACPRVRSTHVASPHVLPAAPKAHWLQQALAGRAWTHGLTARPPAGSRLRTTAGRGKTHRTHVNQAKTLSHRTPAGGATPGRCRPLMRAPSLVGSTVASCGAGRAAGAGSATGT